MTAETLVLMTDRLIRNHHSCDCGDYCQFCAPWACGATSQQIMGAYLEPWSSREGYERDAANFPEFLAVLATAEYHNHWALTESRERRDNLIALINTWNEASSPFVMRTDAEHAFENARAKTAMGSIRRNYIEGVDYRELSNGSLWPVEGN